MTIAKAYEHSYMLSEKTGGQTIRPVQLPQDFLLAVSPKGVIKTLRYGTNGMTSVLSGKPVVRNGRRVGLAYITLTEEARRKGWLLLEEAYELDEDDRTSDCDAVYSYYRQVNGRSSGKVAPLDPAYLPDSLATIAAKAAAATAVVMPPPQRGKGKKVKAKAEQAPLSDVPL